jgi:hypothetical protein
MGFTVRVAWDRFGPPDHGPSAPIGIIQTPSSRWYPKPVDVITPSTVGASQAQRHVTAAEQSGNAVYLCPVKTPREWDNVVELAQLVTITRAKRRDKTTYGEIK